MTSWQPIFLENFKRLQADVDAKREALVGASDAKKARAELEAALNALLREEDAADLPADELHAVDSALVAHAAVLKTAPLKALGATAHYRVLACMPLLLEQTRRLIMSVPHKGFAGIVDETLTADVENCTDMATLESVQDVLDFLASGKGSQGRIKRELGDGFEARALVEGVHRETLSNASNRAKKMYLKLEQDRKAKGPEKALQGTVCVRHGEKNDAFDVVDRHEGTGFELGFDEIDSKMGVASSYEGSIKAASTRLVQEDRTNTFEPRVWMARTRVTDKDGPPIEPKGGVFTGLKPNAQYRLVVPGGTLKRQCDDPTVYKAGGMASLTLNDDDSAQEDKASCSCLWGNPCVNEYGCKDWANRFEVAKRNAKS